MIPEGVDIGKDMSLRISLRRGYTAEVLNRGLDTSVIKPTTYVKILNEGEGKARG